MVPISKLLGSPFPFHDNYMQLRENFLGKTYYHKGIDISTPVGVEIKSISLMPGKIVDAGFEPAGGNRIYLLCPKSGITFCFRHLSEMFVKTGDVVTYQQVIGKTGNTGSRTTGPHLHLEAKLNGNFVDPTTLFDMNT